MSKGEWKTDFESLYGRAVVAYRDGRTSPQTMFSDSDRVFLKSIGATDQEIFDYVEDGFDGGDPSFEDVLAVTEIRHDYFKESLNGNFPAEMVRESELPRKTDAVAGISWLPRIIAKARAKLRGELPPELMYGCGGDRPFLRRAGIRLQEFLTVVRDSGDQDEPIINYYKERVSR